jgi:hypothetical protein
MEPCPVPTPVVVGVGPDLNLPRGSGWCQPLHFGLALIACSWGSEHVDVTGDNNLVFNTSSVTVTVTPTVTVTVADGVRIKEVNVFLKSWSKI